MRSKFIVSVTAAFLAAGLAGCGGGGAGGGKWSDQARSSYLPNCEARANMGDAAKAKEYCSCTLAEFEKKFTVEQLVELQKKVLANDPEATKEFKSIISRCQAPG